ncbi:MAG: dienelactone hydrolase family protein [Pseudomonadales bacterium]|nr:dienelactone hydrolase family protein [Pseudomonadales bacterium]
MSTEINYLVNGPSDAAITLIMAHGAGAAMDSDWMNDVSNQIAEAGIKTVRFEFPYMVERRSTGKKRPPNTQKILLGTWKKVASDWKEEKRLFLSGKSMGGRMASLIIDDVSAAGMICFGFPFHAFGKPPKNRIDHLKNLSSKLLIIQGERDTMGTQEEVSEYDLSKAIEIHWLKDGDHSFKPRKKSGFTHEEHITSACRAAVEFMQK